MVLGIIFVILAVGVAVITPVLNKWLIARAEGENKEGPIKALSFKKKEKKPNIRSIFPVKDIRQGIMLMKDGTRRTSLQLHTIDFDLMGEEEQTSVENSLMALGRSLEFPIQLFTSTETVDTRATVYQLYQRHQSPDTPPGIRRYAYELGEYLNSLMQDRTTSVRRSNIIIPLTRSKDLQRDLKDCQAVITAGLARGKIGASPLNSNGLLDMLQKSISRRDINSSELVKTGALELFTTGEGGVGFAAQQT